MVLKAMMTECQRGEHDKCQRREAAPPGDFFGGVICDCTCHSVELEFWRAIEESRDPGDFELYLKYFPNGPYIELARRRLAQLVETKPEG